MVSGYSWYGGLFSGMVLFFFYTVVNVVKIAFHVRTKGVRFNWFMNGLVPVIGIAVSVSLLYDSFFKTYQALPFQTGTSVVRAWELLVALSVVMTPLARRRSLGAQGDQSSRDSRPRRVRRVFPPRDMSSLRSPTRAG